MCEREATSGDLPLEVVGRFLSIKLMFRAILFLLRPPEWSQLLVAVKAPGLDTIGVRNG